MLNQEGNFELTAQMFVEHANLVLGTNLTTILWIFVGGFVQNL
jgi:hypothetical protein